MTTADDLKSTRVALNESQEAFAGHFGVDQATIHRWETNGVPERGAAVALVDRVMVDLRARVSEKKADASECQS